MLPKQARLSAAEVREVLKSGRSLRAGALSIKYTKAAKAKAAVVVSTKVAKRAVDRNRLRRAGYRALAHLPPRIHAVLFIHEQSFDALAAASLCSKLSS